MNVLERMVLASLDHVPARLMRRFAAPYIAGEELGQALARMAELRAAGYATIVDVLGENVAGEADARAAARVYGAAVERLAGWGEAAYVSVKPTHFGLLLSEELCFELYDALLARAAERELLVRVEMEDHPTVDGTLRVVERLRARHANVGLVLQSRLLRTPDDVAALAPGPLDVRLVKGIYLEPARIAHTEPEPIRAAYLACLERLVARGARVRLATHDEGLGARCVQVLRRAGKRDGEIEFQVLLGVRPDLWERWRAAGHGVRVYVPFGPDWRAYSTRRLKKNPEILRHVVRDTLGLRRR